MKSKMNAVMVIGLAAVVVAGAALFMSPDTKGKKVLFIDSYHQGYPWSDGITAGIQTVFADSNVDLRIHRMDTKRNGSEEFKQQAALKAKAVIDQFKPDVVIATDDNASKYLIVPYYRGGDLPFVFAGVNWDASVYGFPASNVTGMVEVSAPDQVLEIIETVAEGTRLGSLTGDTATGRKETENYAKILGITFQEEAFVSTFEEWKQAYLAMQNNVDILFLYNNAGIDGWNDEEAARFVEANARIPSGSVQPWMAPYVLVSFTKDATEQGEWAATTALEILNGRRPSEIPLTRNTRGRMIVNSKMARSLNMEIPASMLSAAQDILR
jgi:ABC-type uncharacterized transport system substrate-binding protein